MIGTGSSGAQAISEIAPQCRELYVFQRRPQYSVPARHSPIPQDELDRIEANYDAYWEGVIQTGTAFGFAESAVPAMSVGSDLDANNAASTFIKNKIQQIVKDPETAAALTPDELYARCPLCNDTYYESFNRDNVTLVDLRKAPIEEVTSAGIRTAAEEYDLNVIVLATGFDAVTGNYVKIDIRGRNGEQLRDKWADGPKCHLGLITNGFPTLFMIFGPMGPFTNHQPPAHEYQVNWVADAIGHLRSNDLGMIEPTPESEQAWMDECVEIASGSLFPKVDSWINGANVEGKAISVNFFMGGMAAYVERTRQIAANQYEGFVVGAPS